MMSRDRSLASELVKATAVSLLRHFCGDAVLLLRHRPGRRSSPPLSLKTFCKQVLLLRIFYDPRPSGRILAR